MTYHEFIDYCLKNAEFIFVRGVRKGKFQLENIKLSEFTFMEGVELVNAWFVDGHMPSIVIPEGREDE